MPKDDFQAYPYPPRAFMFAMMGLAPTATQAEYLAAFERWVRPLIDGGPYAAFCWLVELIRMESKCAMDYTLAWDKAKEESPALYELAIQMNPSAANDFFVATEGGNQAKAIKRRIAEVQAELKCNYVNAHETAARRFPYLFGRPENSRAAKGRALTPTTRADVAAVNDRAAADRARPSWGPQMEAAIDAAVRRGVLHPGKIPAARQEVLNSPTISAFNDALAALHGTRK